jgi:hypothetical protein
LPIVQLVGIKGGKIADHSIPSIATSACTAYTLCMQYTLRDIPSLLDSELRRRARDEGKSLNAVAVEALIRGAGLGSTALRQRDLSDIAGTWQEDGEFDQAIAEQDRIDEHLWK